MIKEELENLQKLLDKFEKEVVAFRKDNGFEQKSTFHKKSMKMLDMYDLATQELSNYLYLREHWEIQAVTDKLVRGYKQLFNSLLKFSLKQLDLKNSAGKTHVTSNGLSNESKNRPPAILNFPTNGIRSPTRPLKKSQQPSLIDIEENANAVRPRKASASIGELDKAKSPQGYFARNVPKNVRSYHDLDDEKKLDANELALDVSLRVEDEEDIANMNLESERTKRDIDRALKSMREVLTKAKASGTSVPLKEVLEAFSHSKEFQRGLLQFQRQIDGTEPGDLTINELNDQLLSIYERTQRKTAKKVLTFVGKQESPIKTIPKPPCYDIGTDPDYELIEKETNEILEIKGKEHKAVIASKDAEIQKWKEKYQEEHYNFSELKTEVLQLRVQVASLEMEKNLLANQLRDARTNINGFIEKLSRKKFKLKQLKAQLNGQGASNGTKLDTLSATNSELVRKNSEFRVRVEELTKENNELRSQNEELQGKKAYLEQMVERFEGENEIFYQRIEKLEGDKKGLADSITKERVLRSRQIILETRVDETKIKFHREKDRADLLSNIVDENVKLLSARGSRIGLSVASLNSITDEKGGRLLTPDHNQGRNQRISILIPNSVRKELNTSLADSKQDSIFESKKDESFHTDSLSSREEDRELKLQEPEKSLGSISIARRTDSDMFNASKEILDQQNVEDNQMTPSNKKSASIQRAPSSKQSQRSPLLIQSQLVLSPEPELEELKQITTTVPVGEKSQGKTVEVQKNPVAPNNGRVSRPKIDKIDKETQTIQEVKEVKEFKKQRLSIETSPVLNTQSSYEMYDTNSTAKSIHPANSISSLADTIRNLREQGVTLQQIMELYQQKTNASRSSSKVSHQRYPSHQKGVSSVFEYMRTPGNEYGQPVQPESARELNQTRNLFKSIKASEENIIATERNVSRGTTAFNTESLSSRGKGKEFKPKRRLHSIDPAAVTLTDWSVERSATHRQQLTTPSVGSSEELLRRTYNQLSREKMDPKVSPIKKDINLALMYDLMKQRVALNPSLKNTFKTTVQQRSKAAGKSFEPNKFEIDFEDFKEYYETLERVHKKCGDNCPHLRRFYEKIGYWPYLEERSTLPLPRTDIDKLPRIIRKKPVVKGPLKFKGNVTSKDVIKKINASNKKLAKITDDEETKKPEDSYEEPKPYKVVKIDNDKSTLVDAYGNRQTEYEKKVALVREKRLNDRIKKEIGTSFRAKMENFNKNLNKIPEHYDIPKVGPG